MASVDMGLLMFEWQNPSSFLQLAPICTPCGMKLISEIIRRLAEIMIRRSISLASLARSSSLASYISKIGVRYLKTQAASSCNSGGDEEYADNIDWNNLGFGLMPTDYMYVIKCGTDDEFKQGQLSRYGNIELSPSAGVLNYGQGLFEGTKAYRRENDRLFLFRPQQNAIRMQIGAERMCMPFPSTQLFVDAVKQTVLANRRWVILFYKDFGLYALTIFFLSMYVLFVELGQIPPPGKGSLYVRPMLFGSGPVLGLAPASEYTFLVFASPVGNYFKEGTAPLNLYVDDEFHRSARGGVGGVKSITNYAPVLKSISRARNRGFSDVLYLDSVNKRYIEEVSSCNVFILKGNVLSTPATNGTILKGITRNSIIEIAPDLGYLVEERPIPVEELLDAEEVFCTGTAVGVAPVGSITYKGNRIEYKMSNQLVCLKLYSRLTGIQSGSIEDKRGWTVEI